MADRKISEVIEELEGKIEANEKIVRNIQLEKPKYFQFMKVLGTFATVFIVSLIPYSIMTVFDIIGGDPNPYTNISILLVFNVAFTLLFSQENQWFILDYISESLDIKTYNKLLRRKRLHEDKILTDKAQIDVLRHMNDNHRKTI